MHVRLVEKIAARAISSSFAIADLNRYKYWKLDLLLLVRAACFSTLAPFLWFQGRRKIPASN